MLKFIVLTLACSFGEVLVTEYPNQYSVERWKSMAYGYDVEGMYQDEKYFMSADQVQLSGSRIENLGKYEGVKMRGVITAPVTGNYTFWVSARAAGQLWLSSDDSKFNKRFLCHLGAESGSGTGGVASMAKNLWDNYSNQMSDEVYLKAGERYYIEALGKGGHGGARHLSIAWVTPNGEREVIPTEYVHSYVLEDDDADDDYLPDSWEQSFGLDSTDNGLLNRSQEGEWGDYDGDGLHNRLEYLLGTNPVDEDSDDDGIKDGEEYHAYNSDPLSSDAPSEHLFAPIDLTTFVSVDGLRWSSTLDGMIPSFFRGETTWNFVVPTDGHWVIKMRSHLMGSLFKEETVDCIMSIDGAVIEKKKLIYGANKQSTTRLITPYFTAGNHTLTINIDNIVARRKVAIKEILVLEPQGFDLDEDGVPDWVAEHLAALNTVTPYLPVSRVSPYCLEGYARNRSGVQINGEAVESGSDFNHWYFNLPLNTEEETSIDVTFANQSSTQGAVSWQHTNVFANEELTVRKGDELKLVAIPPVTEGQNLVSLELPSVNWAVAPEASASQSTTGFGGVATRAIDGNTDGRYGRQSVTHTQGTTPEWLEIDLGAERMISSVLLYNRTDGTLGQRLSNFRVEISDSFGNAIISQDFYLTAGYAADLETWNLSAPATGRKVRITKLGKGRLNSQALSLAEVEVLSGRREVPATSADSDYLIYEFNRPGEKRITASSTSGQTGELLVHVKEADFDDDVMDVLHNKSKNITLSHKISKDLTFDGGDSLSVYNQGDIITLLPKERGQFNLLARINGSGPIVGVQKLNSIGLSDVLQNASSVSYASEEFSGYTVVHAPLVMTDLPAGGTLKVRIFRAGVTFFDGSRTKVFDVDDFADNIQYLKILFPPGLSGGFCHGVTVYDRNGKALGTR